MSSYTIDRSNSNGLNYAEEDEGNGSDEELQFDGNDNDAVTPMKRNQMNSSYDPSDWSAGFSELLPAGSFPLPLLSSDLDLFFSRFACLSLLLPQ
jgi:hypothetical protein